jgi:hypothetical protein
MRVAGEWVATTVPPSAHAYTLVAGSEMRPTERLWHWGNVAFYLTLFLEPATIIRAVREERVLKAAFGEEYERYRRGRGAEGGRFTTIWADLVALPEEPRMREPDRPRPAGELPVSLFAAAGTELPCR